jgi:hypothetical protein
LSRVQRTDNSNNIKNNFTSTQMLRENDNDS